MKAMKGAVPFASWVMRIALILVIFLTNFHAAEAFFKGAHGLENLLALGALVVAVFLFVGGFLRNWTMTIVSGLILTIVFVILIIINWNGIFNLNFAFLLLLAAASFYFVAAGNGR